MRFAKYTQSLRVQEGKKVSLGKWKTCVKPLYQSQEEYDFFLGQFKSEISTFQEKLWAASQYAILIIFQGMDTSGKDGAISHVMSGVNPQGCVVHSFKIPSEDELKHDFLWRTHARIPKRGEIGIFNRSHYEEVLVDRVHPDILAREGLPKEARERPRFWQHRLADIRHHESYLDRQGIKIVKFFLHISKEEQRQRLLARLSKPKKNWKVSIGDLHERKYWKEYQRAYEACLEDTSTKQCPWFVIPSDDKKNARLLISQILLDEMSKVPADYPKITPQQRQELRKIKKMI